MNPALSGFAVPSDLTSGVFDWNFFWNIVQNFLASEAPLVMVAIAAIVVGVALVLMVRGVKDK